VQEERACARKKEHVQGRKSMCKEERVCAANRNAVTKSPVISADNADRMAYVQHNSMKTTIRRYRAGRLVTAPLREKRDVQLGIVLGIRRGQAKENKEEGGEW
jgi:hypothetical protein